MFESRVHARCRPSVATKLAAIAGALGAAAGAIASPPTFRGGEVPFAWPLAQTLAQAPAPVYASQFGSALAASADLVVVGAPHDLVAGIDAGAAYVYRRSNGSWQLETVLSSASPQHGGLFGFAVSVAATPDREVIAVGEPFRDDGANLDAGSLTVYERSGGTWQERSTMSGGSDYVALGYSVATDGTALLAGAPYSNAFYGATATLRRDDAGPSWAFDHESRPDPADEMAGYYGLSVAVAGPHGLTGAMAATLAGDSVGAAEISNLFADGPLTQRIVLHAPLPAEADEFGRSVAASGTLFAVGASSADESAQVANSGAVFVYRLEGQAAVFEKRHAARYPQQNAYFGWSVSFAGNRLAVGEPQRRTVLVTEYPFAGTVSVFSRSPLFGLWNREATLYNLAANERMGTAVAAAGALVIAGVPQRGSGAAQVHRRDAIFVDGFEDTAPE